MYHIFVVVWIYPHFYYFCCPSLFSIWCYFPSAWQQVLAVFTSPSFPPPPPTFEGCSCRICNSGHVALFSFKLFNALWLPLLMVRNQLCTAVHVSLKFHFSSAAFKISSLLSEVCDILKSQFDCDFLCFYFSWGLLSFFYQYISFSSIGGKFQPLYLQILFLNSFHSFLGTPRTHVLDSLILSHRSLRLWSLFF